MVENLVNVLETNKGILKYKNILYVWYLYCSENLLVLYAPNTPQPLIFHKFLLLMANKLFLAFICIIILYYLTRKLNIRNYFYFIRSLFKRFLVCIYAYLCIYITQIIYEKIIYYVFYYDFKRNLPTHS